MTNIELVELFKESHKPHTLIAEEHGVSADWLLHCISLGDMEKDDARGISTAEIYSNAFECYPEPNFN